MFLHNYELDINEYLNSKEYRKNIQGGKNFHTLSTIFIMWGSFCGLPMPAYYSALITKQENFQW